MEKNTDPAVVIMDRDIFHQLMWQARAGAVETGGDNMGAIEKHIRRFNPALAGEEAAKRKAVAKAEAEERRATRDFLRRHAGKTVFMKSIFGRGHEAGRVLSEIKIGRGRRMLRVDFGGTTGVLACHYSQLLEEAPPPPPPPAPRVFLEGLAARNRSPYA